MENDEARERLEAEQGRVEGLIEELKSELGTSETEDSSELADYDQHPADTASDTFEREKDLSILEQLENELAELQAALERVDAGTYGIDEQTGRAHRPGPTRRVAHGAHEHRRSRALSVRVRLFAQAREAAGRGHDERDATTLGALLDDLRASYGTDFANVLGTARVWVNGDEPARRRPHRAPRRRRGRRPPTRQRRVGEQPRQVRRIGHIRCASVTQLGRIRARGRRPPWRRPSCRRLRRGRARRGAAGWP